MIHCSSIVTKRIMDSWSESAHYIFGQGKTGSKALADNINLANLRFFLNQALHPKGRNIVADLIFLALDFFFLPFCTSGHINLKQ